MKTPWSLLCRVVVFGLLQAAVFLAVTDWRLERDPGYLGGTIDKHRQLEALEPPRILLAGGSSVAFGFDSPALERAFQRPVVNLAMHAALGLEYVLREAEAAARPGDWVLLSPEYTAWSAGGNEVSLRQISEFRLASVGYLNWPDRVRLLDRHGLAILGGWARRATDWFAREALRGPGEGFDYRRRGFNAQGDYVGHHGSDWNLARVPADSFLRRPGVVRPVSGELLGVLERVVGECGERGVKVFLACPPNPEESLMPVLADVEANLARLRKVEGLVVLDEPRDAVYPLEQFYDTRYHLGRRAAQERTRRLIERLRPHAAGSPVFLNVDSADLFAVVGREAAP